MAPQFLFTADDLKLARGLRPPTHARVWTYTLA